MSPESLVIKQGFAEPSLSKAQAGKAYQFEREGYFCLDSRYATEGHLVFNRTVGLRDTGLKSASNAHLIHETPHIAAFFLFQNQ